MTIARYRIIGCVLFSTCYENNLCHQITLLNSIYPSSFKLPLCWLHSLTPVTSLSMLPGIRSLAVAIHLEIHRVYTNISSLKPENPASLLKYLLQSLL